MAEASPRRRSGGRRADAQRSVDAILDAAIACLVEDPNANTADIAARAGVGRVTLYGHFPSRTELVDAAFGRIVTRAEEHLATIDLAGEPRQALADLIASSWEVVFQHRALLAAAQGTMPAERIRRHHEQPLTRVRSLIERGRHDGVFRTDQPVDWLVTVFYTVLHGAAGEIGAGRLDQAEAAGLITATLLAAYSPPPHR
ncbi:TetR/AcrR family transcriptional regulator [Virgisporangium aurantiacum]|uniref:HTH tetR-type domain-containing protein n=1 Tax=Virgisporangium aurantiacum TaxID=175570 RepID=A0A8J3ZKR7_9ACTN|nr:TetR/AcrR family transcriptional regulator [Virgisporangium aurantiacum]GIJ63306.1 hypothetical protein Vau01_108220 [Virgisporangium aurantiacum]